MKKALSTLALAASTLFSAAPANATIVVSFVPSAAHIAVGGNVSVAMNISGLEDNVLSGFDINMLYDNAVLFNSGVTHDVASQWPGGGVFGPAVFGAGDTGVIDTALDDAATLAASQADAFTVLTFTFTGVADGSTLIKFGDAKGQHDFNSGGKGLLKLTVQGACVAVGTGACESVSIPEPATSGLAGLGLFAAGLVGRMRRRSRLI